MMRFAQVILIMLTLAGCSQPDEPDEGPSALMVFDKGQPAPDVRAAVAAYYEPYTREFVTGGPADWDRPIFSGEMRQQIERWKIGFSDEEVAELQDFAWLCECQDWDYRNFKATVEPTPRAEGRGLIVPVQVEIGWNETRPAQLHLILEGGQWVIDDIHSQSFPKGLKAALATAIEHNAEAAS